MTKPAFVGDMLADPKRPQVFNTRYLPIQDDKRVPSTDNHPKPWHVSLDSVTVKQFQTHAKAIRYANKKARKGKRGSKT